LLETNNVINILLITNTNSSTLSNSRLFSNEKEIIEKLINYINTQNYTSISQSKTPTQLTTPRTTKTTKINLIVQDLSKLKSFEEQIATISSSSIVIGMHGAGIANSMYMPIGTRFCCGVIEIFPQGEFQNIRGYGNMARRMGHYYDRLDVVTNKQNYTNVNDNYDKNNIVFEKNLTNNNNINVMGTFIPTDGLIAVLDKVLYNIIFVGNSCFLANVINSPYLV
jgi:hypothetical protein